MSSHGSTQSEIASLDHLVEAASALAKLTGASTAPSETLSAGQLPRSVVSDEEDSVKRKSSKASSSSNSKREIFPQRLMAILADASLSDVVSWLPHGRAFVIVRPDVFTEKVLPKYLPPVDSRSSTKYPSFTRKLNRW